MICMEDGAKARKTFLEADSNYHLSLVFRYLDTFPKPPGVPEWPAIVPAMDAASLDSVIASGDVAVGTPDEVSKAIERYAATGADQLSFGMLSSSMSIESCEEAVETFGKHLLPDLRQGPGAQHDQAAPRRRRLLAPRPVGGSRLGPLQPELAGPQPAVDLLGYLARVTPRPRRPGGARRRRGSRTESTGPPTTAASASAPACSGSILRSRTRCWTTPMGARSTA